MMTHETVCSSASPSSLSDEANKPVLAIIVPCYNEQEVLPETSRQLLDRIHNLISDNIVSVKSKIVFVDDGSNDATWNLIEKYHLENPRHFSGIKMAKNMGHQNALLCGLLKMKDSVDIAISIDADLQDDLNVIRKMIEKYLAGCEIVYGVKENRDTDKFLKKITAQGFYRFMHFLGVEIVYNHADFRLLGKNALSALAEYQEVNLFLRGIVPMLGYKTDAVHYNIKERFAGKSKYTVKKILKLALDGITSLSIKPIRLIAILGIFIFTISLAMIFYSVVQYFCGNTISGWTSLICSVWCIGGLILLGLGIVGEYIGKIYLETKHRPRFIIEKMLYEDAGAPQ
ncbi:MAG: glycosyltransferase family 2 protein [Treponema sp.]|jgi:glycosyltransferase involved in cell wall biosynthesis|nr:glycosyltransferase family 2 protein [Treponema sp.]